MSWKDSYSDICAELRSAQIYELELRRRVEAAHEVMVSGEMPSSGAYCHIPLDKGVEYFNKAVVALEKAQAEVDRISAVKLEMEQAVSELSGLHHIVQYKRLVEGKKYKEISEELGYTVTYLREVASKRTHKKHTQSANAS